VEECDGIHFVTMQFELTCRSRRCARSRCLRGRR
jgi:hypothetical protein